MEFEYDDHKSQINQKKHGISFEEAKKFWLLIGVQVEANHEKAELRFIRIVERRGKFYSSIFTMRENKIRLISVRRSRSDEIEHYHKEMKGNEKQEEDN